MEFADAGIDTVVLGFAVGDADIIAVDVVPASVEGDFVFGVVNAAYRCYIVVEVGKDWSAFAVCYWIAFELQSS